MTTRRRLLLALGTALAAPLTALAQGPRKLRRIGGLAPQGRQESLENLVHLEQGLRDLGWVAGRNIDVEWRFADGQYERLPGLAHELVALGPELLVSLNGSAAALALYGATKNIPIVFVNVGDPVAIGLVESLPHPGRSATELTNLTADTVGKHLEMLRTLLPGLTRVALLWNPSNPASHRTVKALEAAAAATGTKILLFEARSAKEISEAFSRIAVERVGALILMPDAFIFQQRSQIADLARSLRLPSIGAHTAYAYAGGLMTYGANPAESYGRAASFVDRILKGARPGDLPVEQPTRLQLVVNRKTATAIGVAIPAELLLLAEKVIE